MKVKKKKKKKYIEFPLGILRIILPFLVIPYENFFEVFILWFSPWNIKNSAFLRGIKNFLLWIFFVFDCPRNPHFPQLQDSHCFFSILPIVIFIFFFTIFFFFIFYVSAKVILCVCNHKDHVVLLNHIKTYFINGFLMVLSFDANVLEAYFCFKQGWSF